MIKKDTVDKAITTAQQALSNTPGLTWIRKSALSERAYFLGLYTGLSGIAKEDLLKRLMIDLVLGTTWQREADDTFESTTIGRNYRGLSDAVRRKESLGSDFQQMIETLQFDIEQHDRKWHGIIREVQKLMKIIAEAAIASEQDIVESCDDCHEERRHELWKLVDYLEPLARLIALLDTDHNLQSRFEE